MFSRPFNDYRTFLAKSVKHDFNIDRFAYDVFAYMLRISGFPENKVPTSDLKENTYKTDSFVMNVGLSVLPIALYKRDDWRLTFETSKKEKQIQLFLNMQSGLESFWSYYELEIEDFRSKVQFSLAFYIEFILYHNYKDPDASFDRFPNTWSYLCKKLFAEKEDDETFESSLTMWPDVSESWITDFIRKFAIPYGYINNVSDLFSIYAFEGKTCSEIYMFREEPFAESDTDAAEEIVPQPSNVSDEYSKRFLPRNTYLGWNCMPGSSKQTSDLNFFQTSALSKECPTIFFPENTEPVYLPGCFKNLPARLQPSKDSVPPPSGTSDEYPVKIPPENTNSENNFMLRRWEGSSEQLQTSKEYVPPPSTPEKDSIKFFPENTNSENNFMQGIWDGFSGQLQTSPRPDPQPSGTSDECSSDIFHESTNAGLNYIPGRLDRSPGYLQTSKESAPQSSGTSDEYSVKFFPENTNLESNFIPGIWNLHTSSGHEQISEASACVEAKPYSRNINGLNYVIKQCIKKRKRISSETLEIDDCFEKMNIDTENIPPENSDTKRRRKTSGDAV